MSHGKIPQSEDLAKKPLVEAILELRWRLEPAVGLAPGRDPGFKILFGRFFDRVRSSYPTVVDLPTTQIPEEMLPHVVRHQFRAGPDAWPLLQLGPGILTANETAGYTWRTFKPRLSEAIKVLFSSYPTDLYKFTPTHIVLRYLNAIPLDPRTDQALLFLKRSLHTEISLDAALAETVQDLNQPWGINLNLTFPMITPAGMCGLSISTGKSGDKSALIWQLEAQAKDDDLPSAESAIDEWLERAHQVIERWFFTLSRGDLLDSFRG